MRLMCAILTGVICSLAATAARPDSMAAARAYCDSVGTDPIEGIWQYPDASLTVLAQRNGTSGYTLTAISAADASVMPGETIGELLPTAAADTYQLSIATRRKGLRLTGQTQFTATVADGGYSLTLHYPGIQLRINPLALLPFVRGLVRLQIDDPRHIVPKGMIKIYPGYDHEGSLPGKPRYL